MTSLERTLTALGHKEPDRVPLFLFPVMQGARETGVGLERYLTDADLVVEGQKRLRAKYGHDCYTNFTYASIEFEAFGGSTVFSGDGPANAGAPILGNDASILRVEPPRVADCPGLMRALEITRKLKDLARGEVPIIGVAMSPFSLPVMQLGFERYLDVLTAKGPAFERLMAVNEAFCAEWANAQLECGATAICYFDPVSSTTIVPPGLYRETGWKVACRMIRDGAIKGPTATHFASGRCARILDLVKETGTLMIGVSCDENLSELKEATRGKLALMGNLNGIEMRHWTAQEAALKVRSAIEAAGKGGGFFLSDNHGEIPWQVPDEVIMSIAEAAREYGRYPLP